MVSHLREDSKHEEALAARRGERGLMPFGVQRHEGTEVALEEAGQGVAAQGLATNNDFKVVTLPTIQSIFPLIKKERSFDLFGRASNEEDRLL
jgi:hypothetical protein